MMNKVKATGRLIKTGRGEYGYASALLYIKRPKHPDAYVSFVLETVLEPTVTINSVVNVEGYVRGYNAQDRDGKWRIVQYFVATSVKPAQTVLEQVFGQEGHFPPQHEFALYIEGTVNAVLPMNNNPNWKMVGIKVHGNREIPEVISVEISRNYRMAEYDEIKKDDTIVCYGNVKTPQKVINGERRNFMNIILEDYVITNRDIEREYRKKDGTKPGEKSAANKSPSFTSNGNMKKEPQSDTRAVEEVTYMGTIPEKVENKFEETEE